jgi:hypothetical protein
VKYRSETSAVVLPFNARELANALTITVTAKVIMFRLCSKIVFPEFDIIKGLFEIEYKILVTFSSRNYSFQSQRAIA